MISSRAIAFTVILGFAGAAAADIVPCEKMSLSREARHAVEAAAVRALPTGTPTRVAHLGVCRIQDHAPRAQVTFARFANQAHEFQQVVVSCASSNSAEWSCTPAESARHVFSRRRSASVIVVGSIPTPEALRLIEFAEDNPSWRGIDASCASLARAGDRYVLRELEVTLELALENGVVRLVRFERAIL